jgi:hypothetical protein
MLKRRQEHFEGKRKRDDAEHNERVVAVSVICIGSVISKSHDEISLCLTKNTQGYKNILYD